MSCLCSVRRFLATFLVFLGLSAAHAQIIGSLPFQLTNGTVADATQVMANYNYIISQVNANAANGGANSSITSLSGLTTPLSHGQGGSQYYSAAKSTGSANAQVVSSGITPSGFTLAAGNIEVFIAGYTNTGATTLAFNGTTATAIKKLSASGLIPLQGGELVANNIVTVFFDGSSFDLITLPVSNLLGKQVGIASSTTTDLGTALTHNIVITGTNTITSLGSTAVIDYPIYYLAFGNSLVLTYNASSLVLPGGKNIITQSGDTATALYLGSGNWQITQYTPVAISPFARAGLSGALGFSQANNVGTPNSEVDLTANTVIVTDVIGNGIQFNSPPTCTINFTINGIGGLDVGSLAASTWYYTFYASDGITLGCLGSLSPVSPTLPSGYTFYSRVGAITTDGSNNFYRIKQRGAVATYTIVYATNTATFPFIITGNTSSAWVAKQAAGNGAAAPITAKLVTLNLVWDNNSEQFGLAPNANYSSPVTLSNPVAPISIAANASGSGGSMPGNILLESSNIYFYSNNTTGVAQYIGWEDSVSAF